MHTCVGNLAPSQLNQLNGDVRIMPNNSDSSVGQNGLRVTPIQVTFCGQQRYLIGKKNGKTFSFGAGTLIKPA